MKEVRPIDTLICAIVYEDRALRYAAFQDVENNPEIQAIKDESWVACGDDYGINSLSDSLNELLADATYDEFFPADRYRLAMNPKVITIYL